MKNVLKKFTVALASLALVIPLGTSAYSNVQAKVVRPRAKRVAKKAPKNLRRLHARHFYRHHTRKLKYMKRRANRKNRQAIRHNTKYSYKVRYYNKLANEVWTTAPKSYSKKLFKKGFMNYCMGHHNTKTKLMHNKSYHDGYYVAKSELYVLSATK